MTMKLVNVFVVFVVVVVICLEIPRTCGDIAANFRAFVGDADGFRINGPNGRTVG